MYRNQDLEQALRHGLGARVAKQAVSVNLITGTLLVRGEQSLEVRELIDRIETVLCDFSTRTGTPLEELQRRGQHRPVHHSLNGSSHPFGAVHRSAENAEDGAVEGKAGSKWRFNLLSNGHRPPRAAADAAREGEREGDPASQTRWHTLDARRLSEAMGVDPEHGLALEEVGTLRQRFGPNELEQAESRSGLERFFGQFKDLPVLLLAGSAVLSCLTGGVVDGVVILAVITANGVIGYITESSAERTIASLTHVGTSEADVIRGGQAVRIPMAEVVPGDILVLRLGSVVPADARLLEANDLSIDESALTGESLPASKAAVAIEDLDLPLGDRVNMVYRGTLVTGGNGKALVVATGGHTEVGRLQAMVGEVKQPETPMQRQLRELGERTMVLAGAVCGGVFVLGLLRGYPAAQMMRTAVSLAVAAVPEGLPTVAITTLAIGIQRMKQRQVIVRRLDAIETLGSVQVLCFDKTGTITYNRMRVVELALGSGPLTLKSTGEHSASLRRGEQELFLVESLEAGSLPELPELIWLLRVSVLCSEVTLDAEGRAAEGSPTEKALVEAAIALGQDARGLRARYSLCSLVGRTEQRRLMASIHAQADSGGYLVAVKGSPDDVLELCESALRDGQVVPLSEEERRSIRRQNDGMSGGALRVLGFAYAEHTEQPEQFDSKLVWLGLAGLADPPREGLTELIGQFRTAGVRSVMITGDQSATAYAVAKQIGLDTDGELQTLDSVELDRMDPELLAELAPNIQVFSRVSPRHKLRIVQALQKSGLVVAMTGDGINDCPALKAADVGVAMGGGKSPVAREVADVILETDDLHAMLVAIEQGRVIHADIKKAVRFILATNLSEILLTLFSVAAGLGESMSPLQLLWINLVSDIFPELALALQPSEDDVLQRPPREPGSKMFSKEEFRHMAIEGSVLTAGAAAAYLYGIKRYGQSPKARALSFITLTTAQLLHAFSTRSERHNIFDSHTSAPNPYIPLSVGGGIALTLLIQMIPSTRKLFGSRPLPAFDWLIASIAAAAPLVANEITKAVRYSPGRLERAERALPAAASPPRRAAALTPTPGEIRS